MLSLQLASDMQLGPR